MELDNLEPTIENNGLTADTPIDISINTQTFGEEAVAINPPLSQMQTDKMKRVKQLCAELVDIVRPEVLHVDNTLKYYLTMHTIGEILGTQMCITKLLTLK